MKTSKIIESNKLIAKFMGLEIHTDGISWFDSSFVSLKKYHESWDALMPVIVKLQKVFEINTGKTSTYKIPLTYIYSIEKSFERNIDIQKTYDGVVSFVNWYFRHKERLKLK